MAGSFRVSDMSRYTGLVPRYQSLVQQQLTIENQIASGMRLQTADQDPVATGEAQQAHTDYNRKVQDAANIDHAQSFTDVTANAISNAISNMSRVLELAVSSNDGTKSPSDLNASATEIESILQGMVDLGATKYNGMNVLSGSQTDKAAFVTTTNAAGDITSVTYQGNADDLATEYDQGRNVAYNMLGSNLGGGGFGLFQDTTSGVDVFQTLITLRDDLRSNPANISNDIGSINDAVSHLTQAESKVGGVQSRLNGATTANTGSQTSLESKLRTLENTDIADAATRLQATQTSYQAALAAGAQISKVSLLDFLG